MFAASVHGANYYWAAGTNNAKYLDSTSWTDVNVSEGKSNWYQGGKTATLPGSGDSVYFGGINNNFSEKIPTLNALATVDAVYIGNGNKDAGLGEDASLVIGSGGHLTASGASDLGRNDSKGSLVINNGGMYTANGKFTFGSNAASAGTWTVESGGQFNSTNNKHVIMSTGGAGSV